MDYTITMTKKQAEVVLNALNREAVQTLGANKVALQQIAAEIAWQLHSKEHKE